MNSKKRYAVWDNLKFLLIVSVVIGHFVDLHMGSSTTCKSISLFIYSFHIPLFIFISGLFHVDKDIRQKVITFIVIGFFIKICAGIAKILLWGKTGFSLLTEGGVPWFMFALAAFVLMSYILRDCNKYFILVFCIILACFAGYDKSVGDYLVLSRIVVFYPFYVLGNIMRKPLIIENKQIPEKYKIIALCLIVGWGVSCYYKCGLLFDLRSLFTARKFYIDAIRPMGVYYRLLSYGITTLLGASFVMICPKKELPFVTKIGQRTLPVFAFHYLFIYVFQRLKIDKVLSGTMKREFAWILLAVLVVVICANPLFTHIFEIIKRNVKETN